MGQVSDVKGISRIQRPTQIYLHWEQKNSDLLSSDTRKNDKSEHAALKANFMRPLLVAA